MSFWGDIKFRALSGLANLVSAQPSTTARSSSSTFRSSIPVRSQNSSSSLLTAGIPTVQSSILSKLPATKTSASAPSKTESSILKHVERLRKTRQAQAVYKTNSAFAKPAVSAPVSSRPVARPASRVVSSATRKERSIDSHIDRVTKARVRLTPQTSARSSAGPTPSASTVTSRKVSPLIPASLQIPAAVDLAQVDMKLAEFVVAPLALKPKADRNPTEVAVTVAQLALPPQPRGLRSCLKTAEAVAKPAKTVHFVPMGVWNCHRVRPFHPADPPNTVLTLDDVDLIQPTSDRGNYSGFMLYDTHYQIRPGSDIELRMPPPDLHEDPKVSEYFLARKAKRVEEAKLELANSKSIMDALEAQDLLDSD